MRYFVDPLVGVLFPTKKQLKDPVWVWNNRTRLRRILRQCFTATARLAVLKDKLLVVTLSNKPLFSKKYRKWFFKATRCDTSCWYSDLQDRRWATVYLNAHDKIHYGVNLGGLDLSESHVGSMFTKRQATAIAMAWVCNNEILSSVKGKTNVSKNR